MPLALGIDIGGTFTDVIMLDSSGGWAASKQLTTPHDLTAGCMTALDDVIRQWPEFTGSEVQRFVHATTLATNVILSGERPRVAFLGTSGFERIPLFHGAERSNMYDLLWDRLPPLVDDDLTYGVHERINARGEAVTSLGIESLRRIAEELVDKRPSAVAICLLHAYQFPQHELAVERVLKEYLPDLFIARSSSVWPEYREYDRAVATILTAYVGPTMAGYLESLRNAARSRGIGVEMYVMQSNGGVMPAADAALHPLPSIESGPAAGVEGAASLISVLRPTPDRILAFDMGGTTAKASVIEDGRPSVRNEFRVGGSGSGGAVGYRVRMPVLDLIEVGSGGGSVAWIDAGGMLRVGPRSAASTPGPACYGFGGTEPTVTDANLVLGYVSPDYFLGGRMQLDPKAGEDAIRRQIAEPLGLDVPEAAAAIHEIANINMAGAIELATVARGIDPRSLIAIGFGGAGPAHIAELAEQFGITMVIVPLLPGLFATFGLLAADMAYEKALTRFAPLEGLSRQQLSATFGQLEAEARVAISGAGVSPRDLAVERSIDMRYRDQGYNITVPVDWPDADASVAQTVGNAFRRLYAARYGVERDAAIVCDTFRARITGRLGRLMLQVPRREGSNPRTAFKGRRLVFQPGIGAYEQVPVYEREALIGSSRISGPALIEQVDATTVVPVSWAAGLDDFGNLVLERSGAGS